MAATIPPLDLSTVKQRYPRLFREYTHMSNREKDSIIDMNNIGSIKFDPKTGLCTTISFVDFTQPLKSTNDDHDNDYEDDDESDSNRDDDCAMKTDSIANKFFIFLWNCLTACECGEGTEDAHHQYDILSNALNDILLDMRGNVALKFEHLLGWTAAATHHGLSALLSSDETQQQNRTLFKRVADEWKKVLDKTASSTVVGIDLAYHKFAIWICECFQKLLKEARKEYGDHAKYTFNFIRKPRIQKGQSATANAVANSNAAFASSTTSQIMTVDTNPAIVTVTVLKPSKDVKLGLGIGQKAGQSGILVNSIAPGSLFADTDLKVGMTLRSINGRGYSSFAEGLDLVKGAEGTLTIVAASLRSSSPVPSRSASTSPVPIPRRTYTYPVPAPMMPPKRTSSIESYQKDDLGSSNKSSMSDSDDEWKTSDMDDG